MLTLTMVKLMVGMVMIGVGLVSVGRELHIYFTNKKEEKQLHKDFINKTGVYSYLKK